MSTASPAAAVRSRFHAALAMVGWLALCYAAAALGGLAGAGPGEWYQALRKPAWHPPAWVFGPVWTALYSMMAVAAWLVWRRGGWAGQWRALGWFLVQWVFNAMWTPLFFGLRAPGLALVDILLLWLSIALTLRAFRPASLAAFVLMLPYAAWVSFAAVLNFALWRLNA